MSRISRENAYIFRITHLDNMSWLLENGLHCRNSPHRDPNFRPIGNPDLIEKRTHRIVPIKPGGTLAAYVPFYFTHYSPMLYNIKTGYGGMRKTPMSEIVILVSSLPRIVESQVPFVFADRHAYLQAAQFSSDLDELDLIDWSLLAARDFRRNPNDPGKIERYQAEALIHRHVPVASLLGVACYSAAANSRLFEIMESVGVSLKTAVKPDWYF